MSVVFTMKCMGFDSSRRCDVRPHCGVLLLWCHGGAALFHKILTASWKKIDFRIGRSREATKPQYGKIFSSNAVNILWNSRLKIVISFVSRFCPQLYRKIVVLSKLNEIWTAKFSLHFVRFYRNDFNFNFKNLKILDFYKVQMAKTTKLNLYQVSNLF